MEDLQLDKSYESLYFEDKRGRQSLDMKMDEESDSPSDKSEKAEESEEEK